MVKLLILVFGVFIHTAVFATIQTQLDKTSIASDETVTLTISSSDHLSLSPDLEPLKNDFYVIGTSQNSAVNIVNGSASMETQWQVALMPKRTGDLQIPVLTVGKERTTAQLVHVVKAGASQNMLPVTQNNEIFLESTITPKEAFIQEQFLYTVKLYFSRSIENAYLMPPDMADAKITQNGQDAIYTVTRKGKYFRVLERSYLITPQKTGQFQVEPPILKGYLETTSDRYDLYGLGSHAVKPIKVVGQVQTVIVKPKPASFVGQWLPAKKVTIKEEWDPVNPTFHEGDPVTRSIEITAIGATGEQIPAIPLEQSPSFNSYAQTPKRETTAENGQQVGTLKQKIVYIPTTSGKQTLPAIKVKWWNSATKKSETAVLPSKTINVSPSTHSPTKSQVVAGNKDTSAATPVNQKTPFKWSTLIWPFIALLALILWLGTLWLWRKQTRGGSTKLNGSHQLKPLLTQLRLACTQDNAKRTRELFLLWAAQHWHDSSIQNLSDVVSRLEQQHATAFIAQIMQLEENFYSNHAIKWQGRLFWQAFENYQKQANVRQKTNDDPLPPLYCNEEPQA